MSRHPLPMQPWRAGHISVPNGIVEVSSAWPVLGWADALPGVAVPLTLRTRSVENITRLRHDAVAMRSGITHDEGMYPQRAGP